MCKGATTMRRYRIETVLKVLPTPHRYIQDRAKKRRFPDQTVWYIADCSFAKYILGYTVKKQPACSTITSTSCREKTTCLNRERATSQQQHCSLLVLPVEGTHSISQLLSGKNTPVLFSPR